MMLQISPHMIAVTGDLIRGRGNERMDTAIEFIRSAAAIAPVYFVAGNHEQKSGRYGELKLGLQNCGVTVLDDTYSLLEHNGASISVLGVRDPAFSTSAGYEAALKTMASRAGACFKLLLAHRPEKFLLYKKCGINLVLAGHAHGGQIRLPLIGGLYAPGQGVFPKFTHGYVEQAGTSMIINRGLGNSIFPQRLFNKPELVIAYIKSSKSI